MNVSLLLKGIQEYHLSKDVYLFPKYIAKNLRANLDIVYSRKDKIVFDDKLVNLSLKNIYVKFFSEIPIIENIILFYYIFANAKKIDILVLFHYTFLSLIVSFLYKLRNKDGFIYIKGDLDISDATNGDKRNNFYSIIKRYFKKKLSDNIDLLSVETIDVYRYISNNINYSAIKNIEYISNGFEVEAEDIESSNKENTIITVGRFGTVQKNTEFLLGVLEKIDLKGWNFYFIGSIEDVFKQKIDDFFLNNPDKCTQVHFLGPIEDRCVLKSYYKKSKVFISASLWESYGLVFLEAAFYGNYILANNVGAVDDLINKYSFAGKILDLDQYKYIESLQNIINNKLEVLNDYTLNESFQLDMDKVVLPIVHLYQSKNQ